MTQQMWYAYFSFLFCWEQKWYISVYRTTQDDFCRLDKFLILCVKRIIYFSWTNLRKTLYIKEELESFLQPLYEIFQGQVDMMVMKIGDGSCRLYSLQSVALLLWGWIIQRYWVRPFYLNKVCCYLFCILTVLSQFLLRATFITFY